MSLRSEISLLSKAHYLNLFLHLALSFLTIILILAFIAQYFILLIIPFFDYFLRIRKVSVTY
jgi:hypothetical protein